MKKLYHGHRKRLREKFRKTALEGFHDYEVVEILLTYAIPRRDVKPESKALIKRFGGVKGILEAAPVELAGVKGIGEAASSFLPLVKEVARAYLRDRKGWKKNISNPEDALKHLDLNLSCESAERLVALYLNSKNQVLETEILHEGALNRFDVSAREVLRMAISNNARSIIFVHSTGGAKPYEDSTDVALASELERAASAIDIIVHDYLVVGTGFLLSARTEGWLEGGG